MRFIIYFDNYLGFYSILGSFKNLASYEASDPGDPAVSIHTDTQYFKYLIPYSHNLSPSATIEGLARAKQGLSNSAAREKRQEALTNTLLTGNRSRSHQN